MVAFLCVQPPTPRSPIKGASPFFVSFRLRSDYDIRQMTAGVPSKTVPTAQLWQD